MPVPERPSIKSRSREDSQLFEKVIPWVLAGMGILMVVLILFAAGVLLGLIHF